MLIKEVKEVCFRYRHYLIAAACVLILALVLFFTVVYPYYCLNVKLRFIDESTGKPIADTRFSIYKLTHWIQLVHPSRSLPISHFAGAIKTDSQGYAHFNMNYIKNNILLIRNKNYMTGILRHKSSKWHISVIYYRDGGRAGFTTKMEDYNLLSGWITCGGENVKKYSYITLACFNRKKHQEEMNKRVINDMLRNVHSLDEFKKKFPNFKRE